MGRGHGFEHQYYGYGNDGMWMGSSQGHQQQSYAVHEDHTHHRKPFPGMPMMPNMHNMHMPHHSSSSSSSSPSAAFRGGVLMSPHHHHPGQGFQFENEWQGHGYPAGGPRKYGFGPTNNFSEEVTEYDRNYSEERYGGGGAMMENGDEMRFHRNNYGGGFGFNPYDNNFASKPQYGYQHPVEWRARGV